MTRLVLDQVLDGVWAAIGGGKGWVVTLPMYEYLVYLGLGVGEGFRRLTSYATKIVCVTTIGVFEVR